jgi:hypothetical protein
MSKLLLQRGGETRLAAKIRKKVIAVIFGEKKLLQ